MRYERIITISKKEAEQINKHLHVEPTCEDECLGENITIVHTATFDNGIEMDIKCCGVEYRADEESNTAWAEAVLFDNGNEICCTEPSDEYLGEWICEYNGDEYVVIVKTNINKKAVNIKWDTDGDVTVFNELPTEIELPNELTDGEIDYERINDYLSNATGFCHFGYELE